MNKHKIRKVTTLIIVLALISSLNLFWTALIAVPTLEILILTMDEDNEVQQ